MDFETRHLDITQKLNGDIQLTFTVDKRYKGEIEPLNELFKDDSIKLLKVEKKRKKRSLNANSYYWVLLNELARVLNTSDDELHTEMIKRYGTLAVDKDGNKMIIPVESKIDFLSFYKYAVVIGKGTVNGKEFTHYKCLKGSSEMDTKEFSILLDGLISECKEVGVQTLTPQELEKLQGYERR